MDGQATGGIVRFFMDLPDPRANNSIHRLHDILIIALCAVICGADGRSFNSRSRVGSDRFDALLGTMPDGFQFTLPRGERHRHNAAVRSWTRFQFTLPRGERPSPRGMVDPR